MPEPLCPENIESTGAQSTRSIDSSKRFNTVEAHLRRLLLVGVYQTNWKRSIARLSKKVFKWGFYTSLPNLEENVTCRENRLFKSVRNNTSHVLHQFLPSLKPNTHNTRSRCHNYVLPIKENPVLEKTFMYRILYKDAF